MIHKISNKCYLWREATCFQVWKLFCFVEVIVLHVKKPEQITETDNSEMFFFELQNDLLILEPQGVFTAWTRSENLEDRFIEAITSNLQEKTV